jgi:hypothetical protein
MILEGSHEYVDNSEATNYIAHVDSFQLSYG